MSNLLRIRSIYRRTPAGRAADDEIRTQSSYRPIKIVEFRILRHPDGCNQPFRVFLFADVFVQKGISRLLIPWSDNDT